MNININYIRFYVIEVHFIGYIRDYNNIENNGAFDNSFPYEEVKNVGIYFSETVAKSAFDNFDVYDCYSDEELSDADDITIFLEEWRGYEDSEAEDFKLIAEKSILPKGV